jgi:poly(3-hydroxyoctanoate) depolymerase
MVHRCQWGQSTKNGKGSKQDLSHRTDGNYCSVNGGVSAMQVAHSRPELITLLIPRVASGGLNVSDLRAEDWRPAFLESNPSFPRWFTDFKSDLSANLRSIKVPVLHIWEDADPISLVAVGGRLRDLLPYASLHVLPGGAHDLVFSLASNVAPLIDEYISSTV